MTVKTTLATTILALTALASTAKADNRCDVKPSISINYTATDFVAGRVEDQVAKKLAEKAQGPVPGLTEFRSEKDEKDITLGFMHPVNHDSWLRFNAGFGINPRTQTHFATDRAFVPLSEDAEPIDIGYIDLTAKARSRRFHLGMDYIILRDNYCPKDSRPKLIVGGGAAILGANGDINYVLDAWLTSGIPDDIVIKTKYNLAALVVKGFGGIEVDLSRESSIAGLLEFRAGLGYANLRTKQVTNGPFALDDSAAKTRHRVFFSENFGFNFMYRRRF